MPHAPTMRVALTMSDRDGNTGDVHIYLPYTTTADDAFACANTIIPYLHAISDAIVTRVSVHYASTIDTVATPSAEADIRRKLLLFLRNGENIEALTIPSPTLEVFESTGEYAGLRADLQSSLLVDFATSYSEWSMKFRTEDGDIIGSALIAGGLSL